MADILRLIDQLITEHKILSDKAQSIENMVNDSRLISDITKAQDIIVPGEIDQAEKLKDLEGRLNSISILVENHFVREETVLLQAVESYGDIDLVKSLNKLLSEHADLRSRISLSQKRVTGLSNGNLHRAAWDSAALEMLTYMSRTRALLETHAGRENKLFNGIRRKIKVAQ